MSHLCLLCLSPWLCFPCPSHSEQHQIPSPVKKFGGFQGIGRISKKNYFFSNLSHLIRFFTRTGTSGHKWASHNYWHPYFPRPLDVKQTNSIKHVHTRFCFLHIFNSSLTGAVTNTLAHFSWSEKSSLFHLKSQESLSHVFKFVVVQKKLLCPTPRCHIDSI